MLDYGETGMQTNTDILKTIRERFQIIENGFSVDYKNKIQILILSFEMNTDLESLPLYEDYVQERISHYAQDYPDIDLKKLYLEAISLEDLRLFNAQVISINNLVNKQASENDIIDACKKLMSVYLDGDPKIIIKINTLEKFEAVFSDS